MSAPVIFGASGMPEPSPEVVRRLAALDERLSLVWGPFRGAFEVRMRWRADDERWQGVQSGVWSPDKAYDIIGTLPKGCTADDAPPYLEQMLRFWPAENLTRVIDNLAAWNTHGVAQQQVGEAVEAAMDEIGAAARKATRRRPKA